MKKSSLLILGVLLGAIPTALAAAVFSDVSEDAWYETSVVSLFDRGVIEGYSDNTYRPDNSVNRAEMAVMLDRSMNLLLAYDLAQSMVAWSNEQNPPQEITINGMKIVGSTANSGGYSPASLSPEQSNADDGNIEALANMLYGENLHDLALCQESFSGGIIGISYACDFLGEIELNDTEFGTE